MAIKRLRQVIGRSDDFDRDIAYWEALGLSLQFRDADAFAQFAAGDVSLALASAEESFGLAPGTWLPVLEVEDLDGALAAAIDAGAVAGTLRDMGTHGRTVLIQRPDGLPAALFERAPR